MVYDDNAAIALNADIRPETPLRQIWMNDFWGVPLGTNESHKSFRPLTTLTFRANYAVSGLDTLGYHVTNTLLHAIVRLRHFPCH